MTTLATHPSPDRHHLIGLSSDHPDYPLLKRLETAIYKHAGGEARFRKEIPLLLRQGLDEVIDSARSKRFFLKELEKTEKTYIGTKMEILIRNHLGFERGKTMDVLIDGIEVDIKNTVKHSWSIPREAIGNVCLLVREDERKARCWFGLMLIRPENLNPGVNQDKKKTISAAGRLHVHWMLENEPYPENFWQKIPNEMRTEIMGARSATGQVAALCRFFQNQPISRSHILALGHQRDGMKRLRRNGGARDALSREGIAILWGKNDRELIKELGLPACTNDEFISFTPTKVEDIKTLKTSGHID
jgi:Restriction endonuclease NaeI